MAGQSFVLNSTNAEVIIGTIIKEANLGEIDLNGFTSFWTLKTEQIRAKLRLFETEMTASESACTTVNDTQSGEEVWKCTKCVCEYRNKVSTLAITEAKQVSLP